MIRCTIPLITALLSTIILNKREPFRIWLSLIPVVVGSIILTAGEIKLTFYGLFIVLFGCILSSTKSVLTKLFLSGDDKVPVFQLLEYTSFYGCIELFPMTFFTDLDFYTEWLVNTKFSIILLLLFHGFCAFLLNLSNFEANKSTNPVWITVGGNMKQVVMVFLSVILFNSELTPLGIIGAGITIMGATWYSYEEYRKRKYLNLFKVKPISL